MQKDLARAIELHPFFASAYAALGEVRGLMKQPPADVMPQIAKAIALEPSSPWHRLTAARVLGRMGNLDEARKAAEAALRLADTDEARQQAQQMLTALTK
jgi:tetratricopeptide (TPR) repeat protein